MKNFVKKILSIAILLVGFLLSQQAFAAQLTEITATPASVVAGTTTSYTLAFRTTKTIANSGKLTIEFPAGFDVSGASFTSWTGFDGTQNLSVAGQVITITRTSGTNATAGLKNLVLGNIVNHSTLGNNYQVTITTKNSANTVLDGPTGSIYFQIFAAHTETEIDGLYYLRETAQSHYQNRGQPGAGNDLGSFSRTAPTSREERHCSDYVQFFFDENGTYAQDNQINNLYYHIWWADTTTQASLGYSKTGSPTIAESVTLNTSNSIHKSGTYYLYAGNQAFAATQTISGNAIYNFNMLLMGTPKYYPQVVSSPSLGSFIIINLPDNIETLGISQDGDTDYDDDGLSDYEELYTYYTNPYLADTDDDAWDDQYELTNDLDPLDPDSAPIFNQWFIKQYNGIAAADSFGGALAGIGDIDGGGIADILIGASAADPNGIENAGSAYIYSSETGELIRQYDGSTTSEAFGSMLTAIADMDGDGKEDVLISAPFHNATGAVFLYSSGTGELLQEYGGEAELDSFGAGLATIADLDGDAKEDIIIGAPYASPGGAFYAGSAYLYSSGTGNLLRKYNGLAAMNFFGRPLIAIEDLDDDGKEDVVISATSATPGAISQAGAVYVYSSATGELLQQYNGATATSSFGSALALSPDLDSDGAEELIIGASLGSPSSVTNAGSVFLYGLGGSLLRRYDGATAYDRFGTSVSSIEDLDGDSLPDILIGSGTITSDGLYRAGAAYIYSSGDGSLIRQYDGSIPLDYFGSSLANIADLDYDGKEDLLIGASGADPNGLSGAGAVYVYSSMGGLRKTWGKGDELENAFDLDAYFTEANNVSLPLREQLLNYSASIDDNPYIDIVIDGDNQVSFSQPAEWTGTGSVVFTASDSSGLTSNSGTFLLTVSGSKSLNTPTIAIPTVNSSASITWNWTDNSEIEESYRVDYVTGNADDADDLHTESGRSGSGTTLFWTDTDLSPNTAYTVHVHAYQNEVGESSASENVTRYTLAETPSNFSSMGKPSNAELSVTALPNDDSGESAYYFACSNGDNSGWIQTNTWEVQNLVCASTYTCSVKYRNGDGVETTAVSKEVRTSACGIGGSSGGSFSHGGAAGRKVSGTTYSAEHQKSNSDSEEDNSEEELEDDQKEVETQTSFSDLTQDNEFYAYIQELKNAGIINGFADGSFRPTQSITRAEFLKMVLNAAQIDSSAYQEVDDCFADLKNTNTLKQFICYAKDKSLVSGWNGNFYPDLPVTRFEAVKMLLNVNHVQSPPENGQVFDDVQITEQLQYIAKAVELDLVSGYGDGTFGPNNHMLRQEAAKVISKMRLYKSL